MATTTTGFIGLGNMGAPMVRCLARAGFAVRAFDIDPARTAALAAEPGLAGRVEAVSTLTDAARGSGIVITMLPDSKIVRRAVLGDGGATGAVLGLASGTVLVDMSSSYPLDTRHLAEDLAVHGVTVVDAPVSGGVGKAVSGTLAIMAGGSEADVARVTPVLSAMGSVLPTGPLGSGHAIKALNNYVSAAGLVATCEALSIARRFGLDPTTVNRVFNASTGRNNTTENKSDRFLIPANYTSGFALALMNKDVAMARSLAGDLGFCADQLDFVSSLLGRASRALGPEADHTAIMDVIDGGRLSETE